MEAIKNVEQASSLAHQAAEIIRTIVPNFKAKLAIILGSGQSNLTACLKKSTVISYDKLPGFPKLTVKGHVGNMVLGYMGDVPVICLQGRMHAYEGGSFDEVKTYVRTLKLLGCDTLLATNASGSMRTSISPGDLLLIRDHINFQPSNPLVGPNDDLFGPRFYPLDNAYDSHYSECLLKIAEELDITLHQGTYVAVLGPNYETAAEIKAFQAWGGDIVGMSTVPEILVATHCGMRTLAIAVVTNYATGLNHEGHCHHKVVEVAGLAAERMANLIQRFVESALN